MSKSLVVYLVDDAADYRFLVQQVFALFLPQYSLRLFADGLDLMQATQAPAPLVTNPPGKPSAAQPGYAEPGESGLELAQPGLILLDIDMPKLNGMQTLEWLKHTPCWQGVPVVMMSNRTEARFIESAYGLGARDFFTKPMEIMELKETLEKLCQQWLAE